MTIRVGNSVVVKTGVLDPDDKQTDIGGWQGRVVSVYEKEECVEIEWDSITLSKISIDHIQEKESSNLDWSKMGLFESEVELTTERDTPADVRNIVKRLNDTIEPYRPFDEYDSHVAEVIDDESLIIDKENLERYADCLTEFVKKGSLLTGQEEFTWEEKYTMGWGDKNRYEELKKTQPSHTDIFILRKFEILENGTEIGAKVTRQSDKKKFIIALSYLQLIEKGDEADFVVEAYRSWIINN